MIFVRFRVSYDYPSPREERSDFSISKFAFINRADSFLDEEASFVAWLNVVLMRDVAEDEEEDEEEEEETGRGFFTSDSTRTSSPSFDNSFFESFAPTSGFTSDSAVTAMANDSPTFLPRAAFPNSLNGIPNSRVAHTSQLGLQDEPRGSWQTVLLLFLASSMECHR